MDTRFRARRGRGWVLASSVLSLAWLFTPSISHADSLPADAQQRVLAATFEVVQLKPDDGGVTYEKPLPLELIPYQQRVDKYRSVGTAFAIGPNRFITAAHVIRVGVGSQFGPPALRDAAGEVYPMDRVLKYSGQQDFVEFSLQRQPGKLQPLQTADVPPLNDPVFAVGNALAQGIVVRDGVFTSETPEEIDGRWKWLRFTAAASPGNSGGPLVDKQGNVIGVVLRKSASENLNYAVPIKLVAAASEAEGVADERLSLRVAILDAAETLNTHDRIPLPRSLADFNAALMKISAEEIARGDVLLTEHNKDRFFPRSASSSDLLQQVMRSGFPRLVREGQDRRWVAAAPRDIQLAQLEHNGFVRYAGGLFELRAPDDLKLATLYADSKMFMDLLLGSAYNVRRQVGNEPVKVTSLGKAREEFVRADAYGRNWNFKIWAVPFDDVYVVTMSLPTPQGMVSLFITGPSGAKDVLLHQEEFLSDFVWVTYEGTLPRWREFLELKAAQPQIFSKFTLDIDPAYRRVRFHSSRCDLDVTPDVLGLTGETVLSLNFSFFKDGTSVVWDVGGVALGEGARHVNFIDVRRYERPEPQMPEGVQATWSKIAAGEFPYNSVASDANGGMNISAAAAAGAAAPAEASIRYVLTIHNEGAPGQDALHAKLEGLEKGFKALEH